MTARVQHARTATNNSPPTSLLPGQFYLEMGTPKRLWGGDAGGIAVLIMDVAANNAAIAAKVAKAGDTMTGPLVLSGDPTVALGAATRQYVDAAKTAAQAASLPLTGGTLTGPLVLNADPATALGAATKQYADTKLPLTGGTLTGPLVLAADPVANLGAATKQYADTKLPLAGGTLTGPLIQAADPVAALGTATKQYVDTHILSGNSGRNFVHNALFNVTQRVGPFTVNGYTIDRWTSAFLAAGQTVSIARTAFTLAQAAAIGDEAAEFYLLNTFTGSAAAGAYMIVTQPIEDVLRLSGKTVTVSFYAISPGGPLNLGICLTQYFGTGGSPSASASMVGQKVALTTAWQRYSVTLNVPSAVGKTLGTTAGTSYTGLEFWFSCDNAAFGTRNANLGAQSGSIGIWGVQLENGSVMTPLEKRDFRQDLANCQRFYQIGTLEVLGSVYAVAGYASTMLGLPVTMRAFPTLTAAWGTQTNTSNPALTAQSPSALLGYAQAAAAGTVILQGNFTASAEL